MTKKKDKSNGTGRHFSFDNVSFSIVQLPIDQNSPVPSQRILQLVTKDGVTKAYVTESSYFKGETYMFLSKFLENSFEESIMKQKTALKAVAGGRHWVRFNQDTLDGNKQHRVNPETFE